MAFNASLTPMGTQIKYFEGLVVAYDDKFIAFEDGSIININYIQTIIIK